MRFDLGDEEWALLEPLMPKSRRCANPLVNATGAD
jgi:transposase